MRGPHRLFVRAYGAGAGHLLVLVGCFALTWYGVRLMATEPLSALALLWFGAAVVANDLVLLPLLATADRLITAVSSLCTVPLVNHVRIPLLGAGLLLLMFLPGIVGQGNADHVAATGMDQQPYFQRWVWLSAGLVATSALLYVLRLALALLSALRKSHVDGQRRPAPKG